MSVSVVMPQLGESVTEGTVTRWLKKEGEQVNADEPLLEVSTDKVDTEIPSPASGDPARHRGRRGRDGRRRRPAGRDRGLRVGRGPGPRSAPAAPAQEPAAPPAPEQQAPAQQAAPPQAPPQQAPPPPPAPGLRSAGAVGGPARPRRPTAARRRSRATGPGARRQPRRQPPRPPAAPGYAPPSAPAPAASYAPPSPPAPAPAAQPPATPADEETDETYPEPTPLPSGESPYVTPLVRKLAAEHGVPLEAIEGTGVGGRIRKQDVLEAARAQRGRPRPPPRPRPPRLPRPRPPARRRRRPAGRRSSPSRAARHHPADVAAAPGHRQADGGVAADLGPAHHRGRGGRDQHRPAPRAGQGSVPGARGRQADLPAVLRPGRGGGAEDAPGAQRGHQRRDARRSPTTTPSTSASRSTPSAA